MKKSVVCKQTGLRLRIVNNTLTGKKSIVVDNKNVFGGIVVGDFDYDEKGVVALRTFIVEAYAMIKEITSDLEKQNTKTVNKKSPKKKVK